MSKLPQLWVQVLIAILLAIVLGLAAPQTAAAMKPLGDAFIALLRMMLAPIIFTTIVLGLAHVSDLGRLGRMGAKALLYFEVVSTIGLLFGFVAVNLVQPGVGLHATQLAVTEGVTRASATAHGFTAVSFFLSIIPTTLVDAFARGEILQVLLVSILTGAAVILCRGQVDGIVGLVQQGQTLLFRILTFIMRLAPIGAFGALAAAIGTNGAGTLVYLAWLVGLYYATVLLFVFVVLGGICMAMGLSLMKILRLIKEELLLVFGTASGEVALPRLLLKLKQAGVDEAVVGFVLPAGYSFNLDGTSIYMAIAVGFIAQATDTPFTLGQQLGVLAVTLLTSKGGTTVAGGAFVKLAATMQTVQALPLGGLGLLFGVDRLLATAIAMSNVVGNVVATLVIAKWEGAFDPARFDAYLAGDRAAVDDSPEPAAIPPAIPAAGR
ncbi:MAG: dicarboxylate/amino acid:cation symporter [Acetobacteraceae bacterium]